MKTSQVCASTLKVGDMTIRLGNTGDIIELIISLEVKKFSTFMVVECEGKRYEMTERNTKLVRKID